MQAVTKPSGRTMHPFGKIMSPSGGVISSVPQQPFHRSQNMLLWRILNPISIQRSPSPLYAQRRLVCVGANKSETGKQARRRATRGVVGVFYEGQKLESTSKAPGSPRQCPYSSRPLFQIRISSSSPLRRNRLFI